MKLKRLRDVLLRVSGWIATTAMNEPDHYTQITNYHEYIKEIGPLVFENMHSQYWSCTCLGIGDHLIISVSVDLAEPMDVTLLGWEFTIPDTDKFKNTQGDWVVFDAYTGRMV